MLFCIFWPQVDVSPSTRRILQYYTMILQRPRIIVGDAGFEPTTSAPEVCWATIEPQYFILVCASAMDQENYPYR